MEGIRWKDEETTLRKEGRMEGKRKAKEEVKGRKCCNFDNNAHTHTINGSTFTPMCTFVIVYFDISANFKLLSMSELVFSICWQ